MKLNTYFKIKIEKIPSNKPESFKKLSNYFRLCVFCYGQRYHPDNIYLALKKRVKCAQS